MMEEVLLVANTSPEFEFWRVRNTCPQPDLLLSADQLFSNGILLPLHPFNNDDGPHSSGSGRPEHGPEISASEEFTSPSKRWKLDIFKEKSSPEKKREKKCGAGISTATPAELNINIWPFRRSRSAGNGGGTRQRAVATRKVNSAPCSRSNSAGESRKCPSSPGRSGVHIGRSSPVWQVRRGVSEGHRKVTSSTGATVAKGRALKLNVPMCMGSYRQNSVCRSDAAAAEGGGAVRCEGTRGSNLFSIRSIFSRKMH